MDWQDQSAANLPLIQIATDEKIYLFHRLTRLPPSLRKLFENEKIKKVGVAISGDLAKISRKFEIEAKGGVDLRSIRNESGSLEEMAREYLKIKISKSDSVRRSKWSQKLTSNQIIYAATDAEISLKVYRCLTKN